MNLRYIYNVAFVFSALYFAGCADDSGSKSPSTSSDSNGVSICPDGSTCQSGFCADRTPCNSTAQPSGPGNDSSQTGDDTEDDRDAILADCALADTQTSHDHCGYCGHKCGNSEGCVNGNCIICDSSIDLYNDSGNCGACGNDCGAHAACQNGQCVCQGNYSDCDGDGICETNASVCPCHPGESKVCYTGPYNTVDSNGKPIGNCKSGVTYCQFDVHGGYFWDDYECNGEVLPSFNYTCASPTDDADCNGIADFDQDSDGDGYFVCARDGRAADCCDSPEHCNTTMPERVHPGQPHDCYGNNLDDNCSGQVDDEPNISCTGEGSTTTAECTFERASCSNKNDYPYPTFYTPTGPQSCSDMYADSSVAYVLIKALDLCMDRVSLDSHKAGIIEASLTSSASTKVLNVGNTTAKVGARQVHIMDAMRNQSNDPLITPRFGDTFLVLSSGAADDTAGSVTANDECFGTTMKSLPPVYANAHDNIMESNAKCTSAQTVNDPVHLHVQMRAPESAKGFSFDFRFFTREYPHYICTPYNDFFLALLTDENGAPIGDTKDGNISFDEEGNPISVNNAFFTTCGPASCSGFSKGVPENGNCPAIMTCTSKKVCGFIHKDQSVSTCPDGSDELAAYYPQYFTSGSASTANGRGGATAWLTTTAPVKGGQVFNLDFYIWDTGDRVYDSSVIIDNFKWSCDETTVGTGFAPPISDIL